MTRNISAEDEVLLQFAMNEISADDAVDGLEDTGLTPSQAEAVLAAWAEFMHTPIH